MGPTLSSPAEPDSDSAQAEEVWSFDRYELTPGRRLLEHDGQPVKLGSRAIELLIALVRRAGEVQRRERLIADIWGHDIDDINLRVHVAALRRALSGGTEGRRYIVNEPGVGYLFAAPVTRRVASLRDERDATQDSRQSSYRLPRPASFAVGRAPAIADLVAQVPAKAMITLVGAAGVGKSTLALAVATELLPHYADNVRYADLSASMDHEHVFELVHEAISDLPDGPAEQQTRGPPTGSMLLVLDNCEKVAACVAAVVEGLRLRYGTSLHILATAREPLLAPGEWIHKTSPLAVPKDEGDVTLDEAMTHGSVQMFVARMPARADGSACAPEVGLICEICRRLDGIPLAIDMAADRVESLGLRGLCLQLRTGFDILCGGKRTALPHHQTMDTAIAWSHESLTERQQAIFRQLAVFQGEFTLDAARSVLRDGPAKGDVSWDLAELVRKSLVNSRTFEGGVRFSMFACTRGYALQKLKTCGGLHAATRRYARLLVETLLSGPDAGRTRPGTPGPHGAVRDLRDVKWVLQCLADTPADLHLCRQLLAASSSLWFEQPDAAEYCRLLESEIGREGAARDATQMQLHFSLGHARLHCSGPGPAPTEAFQACYDVAVESLDPQHQRLALRGLWIARVASGDYVASLQAARQHRRLTPREGIAEAQATDRMFMLSYLLLGRHALVRKCWDRVAAASRLSPEVAPPTIYQLDDEVATDSIGARSLWIAGRVDSAIELARSAVRRARDVDHTLSECAALSCLCCICLWTGRHDEARRCASLLMILATKHSLGKWQIWAEAYLDALEVANGNDRPRRSDSDRGLRQLEAMVTFSGQFLGEEVARRVEEGSAPWCAAEVLRVRGELSLELGTAQSRDAAQRYFRRAIDLSKRQGALSWELRSTMSLARLFASTERAGEGLRMLHAVCQRFTEGFDSQDMIRARQLMESFPNAERRRQAPCVTQA